MNEISLPDVIQFANVNQSITFTNANSVTFISASHLLPKDISLANTGYFSGNIVYNISGYYGEDIATNDYFYVRTGDEFQEYFSYDDLKKAKYDHIIIFKPDQSHHVIITYTFNIVGENNILTQNTYSQYVHLDPSRWVGELQSITNAEKVRHELGEI